MVIEPWMLREMREQPEALADTLDRYIDGDGWNEAAVAPVRRWLAGQTQILIAASGSSRHAGLFAEVLIEEVSSFAVDVEYASEYVYRSSRATSDAGVIVVSQSGETADTLAALRLAKEQGKATLAITNVDGSSMVREADAAMLVEAGRERAVPATKSFTGQCLVLSLLALLAAEVQGTLTAGQVQVRLRELGELPRLVAGQLGGWEAQTRTLAERFVGVASMLYIGRGLHLPIAREGALKLKESAYVHAEG